MTDATEIVRYLLVGGAVTLADVALYQFLTARQQRFGRIRANILSTTVGMMLGFSLHFILVFRPQVPQIPARLLGYLLTVGCSVYIVQNVVIHLLAGRFRFSLPISIQRSGNTLDFSADSTDRLAGKCVAAAVGMIWNFLFFKWVVYA
jgi:putative flippase GtrA